MHDQSGIAVTRQSETTRAVVVTRRGGPAVLALRTVPMPTVGVDDVLIQVTAAGVAFGDLLLREGLPGTGRRSGPLIPGYDVVGVVAAVGANVTDQCVGEHVAAWTGGNGGYTTHIAVPGWAAVPYPDHLPPESVSALVLNYFTAYQMLTRAVPLADGSTILVHSAAGGVGSALLQLGALRGLRMFGTTSAAKAALVTQLGATPIDYRTEDFVARVRAEAPEGIDAIFDALGADTWRRGASLLCAGGHLVPYGVSSAFTNGRRNLPALVRNAIRAPRTSYLKLFTMGIGVSGYRSDPMILQHHDWYRQDLAALIALLEQGRIAPIIHRTYPLAQAAAAQEELGRGRASGKIVLLTGQG